jgi:molecular chaperone GrpE
MADEVKETSGSPETSVRVVDRRWWARGDQDTNAGEASSRKPTYVEELEQRLQTVMTEHRQSLDEFDQIRARLRREVARDVERGRRAMLVELLDVADNLDRAIAVARDSSGTNQESLLRGIILVRDQFLAKLEGFGVTRIATLGERFDARRHDAVATTHVEDPQQDDRVVAVVREGFAIGDDLLRPASVVVGRFT